MSKFGDDIIEGLKHGLAIRRGEADPASFREYTLDKKTGKVRELTSAEKARRLKENRERAAIIDARKKKPAKPKGYTISRTAKGMYELRIAVKEVDLPDLVKSIRAVQSASKGTKTRSNSRRALSPA